ncbi:hypothetical protein VTN49DRAFT_4978 [Thermomyces lanuginosus]|uniref:uncharacterized protein n=1 Tax=Thermomyces lanuginosus TaxID=5541 RepID=UPI0037421F58
MSGVFGIERYKRHQSDQKETSDLHAGIALRVRNWTVTTPTRFQTTSATAEPG